MRDSVNVKVKRDPRVPLPQVAKHGDAAADLCALTVIKKVRGQADVVIDVAEYTGGYCVIGPHSFRVFGTGLQLELPEGFRATVKSRSGTSAHDGIEVGGGLIDNGYRGELCVILHNHSDKPFEVHPLQRIAQVCIERYTHPNFVEVQELSATERGAGGFGHTGLEGVL